MSSHLDAIYVSRVFI